MNENENNKLKEEYDVEFDYCIGGVIGNNYPIKITIRSTTSDPIEIANKIMNNTKVQVKSIVSKDPRDKKIAELEKKLQEYEHMYRGVTPRLFADINNLFKKL